MKITIDVPEYLIPNLSDKSLGRRQLSTLLGISEHEARFYRKAWENKIVEEDKEYKTVVVISDLHCGHRVGLTPPEWQYNYIEGSGIDRNKWAKTQNELWNYYAIMLEEVKPIDVLIVNGDAIDGTGKKSGGAEQLTNDANEQIEMAITCIEQAEANNIVLTYGTPYHTGIDNDWEAQVAKGVNAIKIGSHVWVNVNGIIFDIKHKVGSSSVPYGRGTSVAKEKIWNLLWSERNLQPKADIVIRSHVHYGTAVKDASGGLSLTTPALQGMGSKFGARQCSGLVDFGITWFKVYEDGTYKWDYKTVDPESHKRQALIL